MTQEATELLKKALTLSPEERAQLVDSLLESLDEPREDPSVVEAAWNDESVSLKRIIGYGFQCSIQATRLSTTQAVNTTE